MIVRLTIRVAGRSIAESNATREEPASISPASEPMTDAAGRSPDMADDDLAWSLAILSRVVLEHRGVVRLDTDAGWELTIEWPS